MASLWGGRFEKDMDDIVKKYNASIFFDQRMYNEDIDGSIAHVTMLGKQGIVSNEEKELNLVLLEQWKEQKGDLRTWTAEEQALFDWLYGTAETYAAPSENQIGKEQAAEIALAAIPEKLQNLNFKD